MILIAHRRNTVEELQKTDKRFGVEVDIRSWGDQLIIHHDPFSEGEHFENWIQAFEHKTLILNIKEEGLEERLIDVMNDHQIDDYFFLDQSFPFLIKWSNLGERRCAVRVSEFESIDTALALSDRIDWVWVDCFNQFPLDSASAARLSHAGLKMCLVSPELQGRDAPREIPALAALLAEERIKVDAVCTKRPELWESLTTTQ